MEVDAAARFARLALDCVHREYPNKIAHTLNSDSDVAAPRVLTPAFYGCYDWHSAVHGHWLLARLAGMFPEAPFASAARAALIRNITPENVEGEVRYLTGRTTFERPYGLAWLLQLGAELRRFVPALAEVLHPLEEAVTESLSSWIAKLPYPDRSGQHANTAFAMGLALDSTSGEFRELLVRRARDFYLADRECPLAYEPCGEDFLSPGLAEADVMRRVLPQEEFAEWLWDFLCAFALLEPVKSPDPSDPKFSHLDGLNLSRAWMLAAIIRALPPDDQRLPALHPIADAHREAGLAAVTGEHYVGGHWLGAFAVYLLTA